MRAARRWVSQGLPPSYKLLGSPTLVAWCREWLEAHLDLREVGGVGIIKAGHKSNPHMRDARHVHVDVPVCLQKPNLMNVPDRYELVHDRGPGKMAQPIHQFGEGDLRFCFDSRHLFAMN